MAETIAELENIIVRFRDKKVLGPFSLTVTKGDFWGIVGPNGAGKSTLLKLLAGLHPVSEGKITVFGKTFGSGSSGLLKSSRNRIGFLLQHHTFYPDLPFTVNDVVLFGRVGLPGLGRTYRTIDIETVDYAIDELNLEHLRYRLYRELSGGERRKVQLARLLAQEADFLLLDEPTAGLDLDWQERLTQLVGDLYLRFEKTIFMVTHDVEFVADCNPNVIVMSNTRIINTGSAREVLTNFDLLAKASVLPPQITQLFTQLSDLGLPQNIIDLYKAKQLIIGLTKEKLDNEGL